MNTNYFFGRFCHSRISRLTVATLVALAWSSLAFCGEIHDAAEKGDLEKVKALLKDHPDLVSSKDEGDGTPLYWAVANNHKDMVELLVASNADVNAKALLGQTPLDVVGQKDIAKLLDTNKSMVTHYENKSVPPIESLLKLSNYFNISIHALSTGQKLFFPFKDGQFGETIFQADQLLTLEEHKMMIHLMEAIIKNV